MFKSVALAFGVAALSVSAMAQDSGPLLDALVKKGVLSDSEAEDIRVNLVKEYNSTSAGKLQISSFVKKLTLFGDARIRYQWQDLQTPRGNALTGVNPQIVDTYNNRYRYRLRAGATYTYDSHWSATVRLETATANDSTNADWGNYWDKNGANDAIKVGQLFLDYKTKFTVLDETSTVPSGKSFTTVTDPGVTVGFNARIGRGPKQVYLEEAYWDPDLNPEGLATELTFDNVGVDGLSFAARGAAYLTTNETVTAPGATSTSFQNSDDDGALFIGQLEGKYAVTGGYFKGTEFRIAPLYMQETGAGNGGLNATSSSSAGTALVGSGPTAAAQGHLKVAALPVEASWKLWGYSNRAFATYGANLDASGRIADMYGPATAAVLHGNNTFWNVGYEFGKVKKQGDWAASAEYRYTEAAAYTPNLLESDFANDVLNQQGFILSASYAITDAITVKGTYYHATPIQSTRSATDANAAITNAAYSGGTANAGSSDILQADLVWKF
ncbi:MAG TPA: putative porin [Candidatus Methylacidiphilales bacterium]